MDNNLFAYIDLMLLLLFFSGYPLIYVLIKTVGNLKPVNSYFGKDISFVLPYAYALTGLLYSGFLISNLFPIRSFEQFRSASELPFLQIWAFCSLLFFIPLFNRKPVISLLHSLVFFFFILRDLVSYVSGTTEIEVIKNDMRVNSYSILINFVSFIFIVIIYLVFKKITAKKGR